VRHQIVLSHHLSNTIVVTVTAGVVITVVAEKKSEI